MRILSKEKLVENKYQNYEFYKNKINNKKKFKQRQTNFKSKTLI